jgi:GNAT superfamily N-acetyltransferase
MPGFTRSNYSSSRRTPGPIRRVVAIGRCGLDLLELECQGLWVPAFAGTTWNNGEAMPIATRPARPEDFDFCARLYFSGMDEIIRELKLDKALQTANLRARWDAVEVEIITSDGADVGWMQSSIRNDALFLEQIYIDAPFQRRGTGTEIIHRLIGQANRAGLPVTLNVVKINPARRLYQRLGFHTTHEDDRKFYMRRETDAG